MFWQWEWFRGLQAIEIKNKIWHQGLFTAPPKIPQLEVLISQLLSEITMQVFMSADTELLGAKLLSTPIVKTRHDFDLRTYQLK